MELPAIGLLIKNNDIIGLWQRIMKGLKGDLIACRDIQTRIQMFVFIFIYLYLCIF